MKLQSLINRFYQIDAFTSKPFKGNPAGVVIMKDLNDTDFMQKMAAEINLSETAFLCEVKDEFHIRFFTPYSEIALCGHATLAAAHVLYQNNVASLGETIIFKSSRHQLIIQSNKDGIHMQFPIYDITPVPAIKEFVEITGLSTPQELYKSEHGWYMAYYDDPIDVVKAHPHLHHMKHTDFGHLIVTAPGNKKEGNDYILRCFVPALGIDEDPVTGSAQCVLAPYWQQKLDKTTMTALQVSARSGIMHINVIAEDKIEISGHAVTVLEGAVKV